MAQPTEPETPDLAAEAAALYHRCRNELRLPETLAVRIAGDFYQALAHVAAETLRRPRYVLSSGGVTPIEPARDDRTIMQRLRDQLGRSGQ